ncbi:UNKNOWN [Stylonychia lemnae]|uniref:Uncharacterized protein n=1 Tax=Stylonychia lemnae TaxID=5949 RepID=A0A078AJJ0_STYLE|nr:UNKNOWN [Stylonychia lemnae]|eukprot:CDW82525.1 UNKNOWN [Stylonychia lemnae]
MDKLGFLKSSKTSFRDWNRLSRSYRQPQFQDKLLQNGQKAPFKHSWAMLSHMHDLRVWTLAYAPQRINNLQRLQEIHLLNQEMWYMVTSAMWKRIIVLAVAWILVTRIFKKKYMNQGMFDTHDTSLRDTTAHM